MDDLVKRLRARKRGGGFKHTVEDGVNVLTHQPAPDPLCQEAAAALEAKDAEIARLRDEAEKWKKAFAAQSGKLQNVLHIPGVRAALQAKE